MGDTYTGTPIKENISLILEINVQFRVVCIIRRKCIHQKVNQKLARLSEVDIQLLGLTNKPDEFMSNLRLRGAFSLYMQVGCSYPTYCAQTYYYSG